MHISRYLLRAHSVPCSGTRHEPRGPLGGNGVPGQLMNAEIDLLKFEQSSGHLKWLPVVAAAFLRQLPQWRVDFATALAEQNPGQQLDLLHKIKGSCHAVAAYKIIEVINQAEVAHGLCEPLAQFGLLSHLERVETDLRVIVANAPAQ